VAGGTITATTPNHYTARITARTTAVGFRQRTLAGAPLAMTITGAAVGLAATGHADDGAPAPSVAGSIRTDANCKTEPFGFLGPQRRTLCDGPIASDGRWRRERTIWMPAQRTPESCSSGSDFRSFTTCYGYWVDEKLVSNESYPVRPETVLPDDPVHLD
jgi:hypothetical protein